MWRFQQFLRLKRLQCAGYTVSLNDPCISSLPPKESTGRRFQRKNSHRKVTVRWGRKKYIVLIQIRKWKTAAWKGDRERRPVWQRPETVRSVVERGQEWAVECGKASGHLILDGGLINSRTRNFSLRHRIPDRSWRLSRLLDKEFRKSDGKGFNPINYRLSALKSRSRYVRPD